ncbi:hypothetical protein GCM10010916_32680 [Paenibacillus abyssi]|uniref:DUF3886 domain-containing protein n=1 Tax=Paenibacillus abyssi TaxID=1340531 RepID=A0A917D709_9BACL|nr:hypothetical protein GCM10010916_32680 [Paenibacillus abyssi]
MQPSGGPNQDKPATLKDLLNPEILNKLKEQSEQLKTDEAKRKEEERKQAEHARKAEEKRLEQDFSHLLENSKMDWRKFK